MSFSDETTIPQRQLAKACRRCGCLGVAHAHYASNSAFSRSCSRCGREKCPAFKPIRWWHK